MEFLFWLSAIHVVYIYLGYPVLIKLLAGKGRPIAKDDTYQPKVSILIAAFNEEKDIADTINNKIALDYPRDKLEILVVSDESEDRTDEIVTALAETSDVSIRLVRHFNFPCGYSRNVSKRWSTSR